MPPRAWALRALEVVEGSRAGGALGSGALAATGGRGGGALAATATMTLGGVMDSTGTPSVVVATSGDSVTACRAPVTDLTVTDGGGVM